jgi:hypoxanthine phosphoribosyltransferase
MDLRQRLSHRELMEDAEVEGPASVHPSDGRGVEVLITEEQLSARVRQIGAQIRADVGPGEITLLSILKGSFIFTADLCRAIPGPVNVEFLGVTSYGNDTRSSGAVRITHDLERPISGRHVIIVEDIVDTGLTLAYLKRVLSARHPASLRICALLEKPLAGSPIKPDYVGFEIGDDFVVGYGLDWAQRLRNLPYVGVIDVS